MRYTGEVRLRLIGPRDVCASYISRARTILGGAIERDSELGIMAAGAYAATLPDGTVITVRHRKNSIPIIQIDVTAHAGVEEEKLKYLIRSAWVPEGIILTPSKGRKDDDTYVDWGLPSRVGGSPGTKLSEDPAFPYGLTPNGSLPQVLLNRFKNNKYLDRAEFIVGLPPEVSEVGDTANMRLSISYDNLDSGQIIYESWHYFSSPFSFATPNQFDGSYQDGYYDGPTYWSVTADTQAAGIFLLTSEEAGTTNALLLMQQFNADGSENYFESKAADVYDPDTDTTVPTWFCHKPEELLYQSVEYEDIYLYTNTLRVGVGQEPVYRQIRGDGNSAYLTAYQCVISDGLFFHSHPDFQPGYRTTGGRVFNATGRDPFGNVAHNTTENILATSGFPPEVEDGSISSGTYLAQLWENSPIHYVNMVDSRWTDFSHPYFSQFNGSKGASHIIGSYGASDFDTRHDYGSDPAVLNPVPINPPALNATIYTQQFSTKEAWLPIYDLLHEGVNGTVGTFNGSNPYSHAQFTQSRRFGWNRHVYEIPGGLVPSQGFAPNPAQDDFLGGAGCAMIIMDGQKWMRAVYWHSDTATDPYKGDGVYPFEGDYCKLVVVKFPLRVAETAQMPWRNTVPGEWEVEWEYTFYLADGWLSDPPGKVVFNSTGSKFTFTHHKIGGIYTDALDFIAQDWTTERSPLETPRAAIQCHHFEWDADLAIGQPYYEMAEYVPEPLIATVQCGTGEPDPELVYDGSEFTNYYIRTLKGTYDMFPHYNAQDELKYIQLDIDEHSEQVGNRTYNALNPFPYQVSFCWRIRKLVFPSGKEVTYMQQYMDREVTAQPFNPTDSAADDYRAWPGTGEASFYCVIHWLDEVMEDVIYSKIVTMKRPWEYNNKQYYRTNGDISYIMDLYPEPDTLNPDAPQRLQEVLWTLPEDNTAAGGQPALNYEDKTSYDFRDGLNDTRWIYAHDVSPCTFMVTVTEALGAPHGYIYADTAGINIPDVEGTMVFALTAAPGQNDSPIGRWTRPTYRGFPEKVLDAPWNRNPFEDYEVSAYTGYGYYGDSNIWYFGTGKKELSFMNCNIAPMFSRPKEVDAKIVRYDDRVVVRVGIQHIHKVGYLPPPGLRPAGSSFSLGEWTYYAPPDEGEVLLWANFDIDAAVGISDVRDIWPMGKIV